MIMISPKFPCTHAIRANSSVNATQTLTQFRNSNSMLYDKWSEHEEQKQKNTHITKGRRASAKVKKKKKQQKRFPFKF